MIDLDTKYLQIIQDVFDMTSREVEGWVPVKEFLGLVATDP